MRHPRGIDAETLDAAQVVLGLRWEPRLCTSGGLLHGGAIMALADSAGAVCASLNLREGATTTTIESKTNFLAGVTSGRVTATATPLHRGRRFIVVETDVRDESGRRVAEVTQTQAVLEARPATS